MSSFCQLSLSLSLSPPPPAPPSLSLLYPSFPLSLSFPPSLPFPSAPPPPLSSLYTAILQVSSFCELALALACSFRHAGASESEALSFNASLLARELERLLPSCPNPSLLDPLLVLLSSVKPATNRARDRGGTEVTQSTAQESVLAHELRGVLEALILRADEARTRIWRHRSLAVLRAAAASSETCAQGLWSDERQEDVEEHVLKALDHALAAMPPPLHVDSGLLANPANPANPTTPAIPATPETNSEALEVAVAAVVQAYEERTVNRWLWARVHARYAS